MITSLSNPRVKQAVALRDRSARNKHRRFLVEGALEVARAAAAGISLLHLFVCRDLLGDATVPDANEVIHVSRRVYEKIAYRKGSGGLLAVADQPPKTLDHFAPLRDGVLIVAVGLEKPGNLGAILRTADAAGAAGLILCDKCTDLWNPNVIRASLGTVFAVPTAEAASEQAIAWLRERGRRIVAAHPDAGQEYTGADLTGPLALVLGEEHGGLSKPWCDRADLSVRIPMLGSADSLNVSTCAAVLLYEAVRQAQRAVDGRR